jgi:hypothetical protein
LRPLRRRDPNHDSQKKETDIELGALSVHNCVLTLDKKLEPLKSAGENSGNVIFLNELSSSLDPSVLQQAAGQIDGKI